MPPADTPNRLFRSAGAATFSQLWRVVVTFATHLVLRRYIPRQDWGLYDWVEVVFLVLGGLRDLGLPAHSLRVKPRPFGNLLRVELVWGAALAVLAAVAAPVVALGFREGNDLVVPVLRAMTLFLFLEGLAVVPRTFYDSELAVGKALLPEIVRNLVYAGTSIVLAVGGHGVWSIVVAQVAATATFAAVLWLRAWRHIPLPPVAGGTLKLLRDSTRLSLIWILTLLISYVDRLILAAQFSPEVVGVYGFAYWAAFIVPTIMVFPVVRAAYPAFVAFAEDPPQQLESYRLATLFLLAMEVPVALFLFTNADRVLLLVGGPQWAAAAPLLRILCFAPLLDPFSRFGGVLLMTRHRDRTWIAISCLTLASFVLFGVLFTRAFGPLGMAWANYVPLGALVMVWAVRRVEPAAFSRLARDLAFLYLVPLPFFAAIWLLPADGWGRFVASGTALAVIGVLYLRRFGPSFVAFLRGR